MPIIEIEENKFWMEKGQLHREDGPAVESTNGKNNTWWINGFQLFPNEAVNNVNLKDKYPKLIEVMVVYLVHNS